jgi:hypothetical protein
MSINYTITEEDHTVTYTVEEGIGATGSDANVTNTNVNLAISDDPAATRSALEIPINNFTASTAPTANDDETEGYSQGSKWYGGGEAYLCVDPTEGAAVWVKTTLTADELGDAAFKDTGSTAGTVAAGVHTHVSDDITDASDDAIGGKIAKYTSSSRLFTLGLELYNGTGITEFQAEAGAEDYTINVPATDGTLVLTSDLSPAATSGDYNDLENLPTLGSAAAANTEDFAPDSHTTVAATVEEIGHVEYATAEEVDAGWSSEADKVVRSSLLNIKVEGGGVIVKGTTDPTESGANTGTNSFISGSGNYSNSGYNCQISGTNNSTNSGNYCSISGLGNNSNTGSYCSISGGNNFSNTGSYCSISGDGNFSNSGYNCQISGYSNYSNSGVNCSISGYQNHSNSGNYCQISGSGNYSNTGNYCQISGNFNHSNFGNYCQISGSGNYSNSGNYCSISGTGNSTNSGYYCQISGNYNNFNTGYNCQISGFNNYSNSGSYCSISGDSNYFNTGRHCQISGYQNYSNSGNSCQISGALNHSNSGSYCQISGQDNYSNSGGYCQISGYQNNSNTGSNCQISGDSNDSNRGNW